jgi:hypothetical protein
VTFPEPWALHLRAALAWQLKGTGVRVAHPVRDAVRWSTPPRERLVRRFCARRDGLPRRRKGGLERSWGSSARDAGAAALFPLSSDSGPAGPPGGGVCGLSEPPNPVVGFQAGQYVPNRFERQGHIRLVHRVFVEQQLGEWMPGA